MITALTSVVLQLFLNCRLFYFSRVPVEGSDAGCARSEKAGIKIPEYPSCQSNCTNRSCGWTCRKASGRQVEQVRCGKASTGKWDRFYTPVRTWGQWGVINLSWEAAHFVSALWFNKWCEGELVLLWNKLQSSSGVACADWFCFHISSFTSPGSAAGEKCSATSQIKTNMNWKVPWMSGIWFQILLY